MACEKLSRVLRVPLVGDEARLIGAAVDDGAHQVLQIEVVIGQIFRQRVEQRRIDGGLDARMSSTGSMMPLPKK